jgi:FixJ family two-component response regulator
VRDNGHGIDAEARKHLFEPFFTTKPGEQGLGLGLTLSASLAAATGGNLAVEHPASGGTAFVLSLPLASPLPSHMNHDLTVLIVEDDPMCCSAASRRWPWKTFPAIGVGSAEEALERIGDNFAGIVISDIRLPGIDGLELLSRLKARDRSLPVVLITGHGDISMAVGAMRNGAYDFMEKPFSPERLVDVARRALEQRSLARKWSLRRQLAERDSLEGRIIGRSPAMQNCAS